MSHTLIVIKYIRKKTEIVSRNYKRNSENLSKRDLLYIIFNYLNEVGVSQKVKFQARNTGSVMIRVESAAEAGQNMVRHFPQADIIRIIELNDDKICLLLTALVLLFL